LLQSSVSALRAFSSTEIRGNLFWARPNRTDISRNFDVSIESDKNKHLIRRWIEFSNTGFSGSFDEFISHDYVGHLGNTTMDRNELERLERQFSAAFPDARHTVDDLIAEGDRVVLRTTAHATHRGNFEGIAPTDRSVEFTGLVVYRIQNGQISESWGEIDFLRLIRELRRP
jgi:steroid delta-isomerase-like uncharacterized protein